MKPLTISVFRHGQSSYGQGNIMCPIDKANDLCAKPLSPNESLDERQARSIAEVRISAQQLSKTLDISVPVTIVSSPVGRTLHTAKIIAEVLTVNQFMVNPIQTEKKLGEVEGFSWTLFEPLMNGGTVTYHDEGVEKSFEVNEAETNPFNHEYPQYFVDDDAHRIPSAVKEKWPEAYRCMVEQFEKFDSVIDRFLGYMEELATKETGHFILVTHDCGAMYLALHYTKRQQMGLVPGTYLSIVRRDKGLFVTRVGDITNGNSETDFFAQRREYHRLCELEAG